MDFVIEFFRRNPLLLMVALVWLAGLIGNVVKASKRRRERAEAATRPTPMPAPESARETRRPEPARLPERTAEDIAREMRRILGVETEPTAGDRSAEPVEPPQPPPLPARKPRPVAETERAPVPVLPTTSARKLTIHVDPHVGEGIPGRSLASGARVGTHELGSLGGRVHKVTARQATSSRYALTDLKRAIVLNEILGKPLALRSGHRAD